MKEHSKNTVNLLLAIVLLALLDFSGCGIFGGLKSGSQLSVDELAFYHDEVDVASFIHEEDSPKRQASLRLIAQAMQNPSRDVSGDMETALRIDSFNPFAYYYYALTLFNQQQFQKAELMSRRAVDLFASEPLWKAKAYVLQARSSLGLDQQSKASELFQRAKQLDPKNPLIKQEMKALGSEDF